MGALVRDGIAKHSGRLLALLVKDRLFRLSHNSSVALDSLDRIVRSLFVYQDEDVETLKTVGRMLDEIDAFGAFSGDCDDVSIFTAALLRVSGFHSRFVAIRTEEHNPYFEHVFTDGYGAGTWKRFDATVPVGTQHVWVEALVEDV